MEKEVNINFNTMNIKNIIILLAISILLTGCEFLTNNKNMENTKKNQESDNKSAIEDTTPRVTGIGGIFFTTKDPKATREWYGKNLGLEINDYGSSFEFRNTNKPEEINYLQWSPFEENTEYFLPSEKDFMINYRVNNIEALVKKLIENGVTIVNEIESYDYGKFVHIMDPDGNKIELWEPVDSVLTKIGSKTTK
jgi:predicted enzyme related to lactoylglutathione lyase